MYIDSYEMITVKIQAQFLLSVLSVRNVVILFSGLMQRLWRFIEEVSNND